MARRGNTGHLNRLEDLTRVLPLLTSRQGTTIGLVRSRCRVSVRHSTESRSIVAVVREGTEAAFAPRRTSPTLVRWGVGSI